MVWSFGDIYYLCIAGIAGCWLVLGHGWFGVVEKVCVVPTDV